MSKHVALVGELSRLVGRDKLLEVGEVEQGLATSSGADYRVSIALVGRIKLTQPVTIPERASYSLESGDPCME